MKNEITFAVQPSTWINFDPCGALWATDITHARALARILGVPCTLWACPPKGREYAFTRI